MSPLGYLLILILCAMPVAWLVSEFRDNRRLRILLGLLAILVTPVVAWGLATVINRFNYNAWYGGATGQLISTSIQEIEDGQFDRVMKVWRALDRQYQPTYENRANYDVLVEQATARMRGDTQIEPGSAWDATVFTSETWFGHWEDGHGYWLVIDYFGDSLRVVQSGQSREKVHDVSLSSDCRTLRFKEGDKWLHTMTLSNKYEATYEWFDLTEGKTWNTRPVHKLIRASNSQKIVTSQNQKSE